MLLSTLALAASLAGQPITAPRIDLSSEPVEAAVKQDQVIYLGCQISLSSLTDCRVVNEEPVDPEVARTAVKLARQMTIPQALADRAGGHIVVKLNVTP
jgi:hypothetical protein